MNQPNKDTMTIQVLPYQDLTVHIYGRMKEMILTGRLKPGQKVVQEKLARELGVSRTPLIKAMKILENEMLIESIPRRGMVVKQIGVKEILDAFYCREALECLGVRLAARNITDDQIARLENMFVPFLDDIENVDFDLYRKTDQKFHVDLMECSNNQVLRKINFMDNVLLLSYQQLGLVRAPAETLPEHLQIIDALKKRDAVLAERVMREHIQFSIKRIEEEYRNTLE